MTLQRRNIWYIGILAILLAAVVAACDDTSEPTVTNGDGASEAPTVEVTSDILTVDDILAKDPDVAQKAELEWGSMFEESGALAGFGVPARHGLIMAVEEINAAGGFQVGDTIYTIKLLEHDTQSDIARTVGITQELIRDSGVNVIFGPAAIGDAEATIVSQRGDVIHLCPCPDREFTALTTREQVQGESRLIFQTLPPASRFLPPGARSAAEDYPQFETFATICVNSTVGLVFCQSFEDAYTDAGFEHVGREVFPPGTEDFTPLLTNLKSKNPDMILNFVDAGLSQFALLRQSWELDVGEWYIAVALEYDVFEGLVGGEGIRDKIVSAGAAPRTEAQYTSETAEAFFEQYKVWNGGALPPAAFAALLTYDPAYMLIAAMQQAGTVEDTAKITDALRQIHFSGIGEDDMFFDKRNLIIAGNDTCLVFQGEMSCEHIAPPPHEE